MRRKCILMLGFALGCSLIATSQTEKKAKSALLIASVAKIANVFGDEINLQPAEYVVDNQGKIISQNFLYPAENEFYRIDLVWEGDNLPNLIYINGIDIEGRIAKNKANLVWKGDNLQSIKVDGFYRFNYNIIQKDNSLIIEQKEIENGSFKIVYEAFFEGDKLKRIEKQLYKGSEKIINGTIEFGYFDNKYSKHIIVSKYGKPLKPKFESQNAECYYKSLSEHSYEIVGYQNGQLKKMYCNYNNDGQLVSKKYTSFNGDDAEEKYTYIDNRLFQKTTSIAKEGKLLEKKMRVYFDSPNQDLTNPVYENKQGDYEFDSNDELVFEKRDLKYRRKTNGVWSSWQQVIY